MDALVQALSMALDYRAVLAAVAGTVVGLVFGSIPGLTYSMALALMLPFTFGMAPTPAIALLLGVYVGGMTGGSVSSILLGIPGTPSAAATVFDGYAMALKGQASVALGSAVIASVFGGIFSLVVMLLLLEQVATAVPEESVHSVSVGTFRLPRDFARTLGRMHPQDPLLAAAAHEEGGSLTYGPRVRELLLAPLRQRIVELWGEERFYPCGEPAVELEPTSSR